MHAGKAFFGTDEMAFAVVRIVAGTADVTRPYSRFTDVVKDVIDARIYQGLHFRAADDQGAQLGQQVAEWVAARYFQPQAAMPGLPATGAGGGGDRLPVGWLALAVGCALVGGGRLLRRGKRRA